MDEYQQLKDSSVDLHVFNGSKETHADKNEVSKRHATPSSCEKLSLREKEITSIARKLQQFVGDKINRTKFFYTCLLCMKSGFQGWMKGLFGPVFLDLQRITGSSQAACSWLIIACYAGQIVAAPVGGMLYGKVNTLLTMGIGNVGAALTVCCIPWCSLFPLMLTAYLVLGLFLGPTDTISNTDIFYIWEGKGKILIQGLHLTYTFGGVLSPLFAAPFLSPADNLCANKTDNNTGYIYNPLSPFTTTEHSVSSTENNTNSTDIVNSSSTHHCSGTEQSSQIYIIFSISGAIALTVAVGFFVLFCTSVTQTYILEKFQTEQDQDMMNRVLPKLTKYVAVIALSIIIFLGSGIDYGYNTFLVSFLVKQMNWTKSMGSHLTSLVFFCDVVGRVLCIFLVTFVLPEILTFFHCLVLVIGCIGFLISAFFTLNIGIWVFGSMIGYARSIMFTIGFVWANERLFVVTGQIASVFLIAWGLGVIINNAALGYIIESFSEMSFCYILLGESIILLGVCIISVIMTKIIVINNGTPTTKPNK